MQFRKVQGLGNDFVMIDLLKNKDYLHTDLSSLARKACHRRLGIGADGLVLILPDEQADARMRIFNPDGSEPQICGNAIRCVARYLFEHKIVPHKKIRIETLAGIIAPEIILQDGKLAAVKVDMGEPRLERKEIPMIGPPGQVINEPLAIGDHIWQVTAVSMGNPHCLIFVDDPDTFPLAQWGPQIENHPSFPERTNVEFIQVLNRTEIKMRVWERGAGATLACGTGTCATLVGCVLNGLTNRKAAVHLALGDLLIDWAGNNHVYMTGPAEEVFCGEFPV
ncbi:MAG TPA: diaminopimelate epimerase [Desulfotomaculum sp.]|nr:MAG: Diaminopimelate epimerase [Desulfotomaculum sp. 46_80]KUK85075.1 MAG: Diaminopimelate epimerase [Desulfofundulus kuznetsovii]HAG09946.1 diaminopimelate epimerase [Desulfotomaculum sp.]HBY04654.1 diaminopimelate epimerase [Desulfotomaculum sp.]